MKHSHALAIRVGLLLVILIGVCFYWFAENHKQQQIIKQQREAGQQVINDFVKNLGEAIQYSSDFVHSLPPDIKEDEMSAALASWAHLTVNHFPYITGIGWVRRVLLSRGQPLKVYLGQPVWGIEGEQASPNTKEYTILTSYLSNDGMDGWRKGLDLNSIKDLSKQLNHAWNGRDSVLMWNVLRNGSIRLNLGYRFHKMPDRMLILHIRPMRYALSKVNSSRIRLIVWSRRVPIFDSLFGQPMPQVNPIYMETRTVAGSEFQLAVYSLEPSYYFVHRDWIILLIAIVFLLLFIVIEREILWRFTQRREVFS